MSTFGDNAEKVVLINVVSATRHPHAKKGIMIFLLRADMSNTSSPKKIQAIIPTSVSATRNVPRVRAYGELPAPKIVAAAIYGNLHDPVLKFILSAVEGQRFEHFNKDLLGQVKGNVIIAELAVYVSENGLVMALDENLHCRLAAIFYFLKQFLVGQSITTLSLIITR